jgi:7,8-dihydropterin-6-yl-methyl-4-(beta-D-ribofuranosyl)aminobenzene 5'-phosphate synthase
MKRLAGQVVLNNLALELERVGGEECFCSREWTGPPVRGNFGALDRKALEEANLSGPVST